MARVRQNFFSGTLSAELIAGATTLSSAALSSFPAVASPAVAYLVIDPAGTTPEIVKVTAHTASASTATISRGQDDTISRTWAAGTSIIQAPIGTDLRKLDAWFDVTDYGATGDGATDDTTAIQATITAAGTNGGCVFFPPGTYVSGALSVTSSDVTLAGVGGASVVKAKSALNGTVLAITSASDVVIRDLAFDGNRANQASGDTYTSALIRGTGLTRFTMVDCAVSNAFGVAVGVRATSANTDVTVRGCRFYDIGFTPVHIEGDVDRLAFAGNTVANWGVSYTGTSSCPGFAIWAGATGNNNWTITDNIFEAGTNSYFGIEAAGVWGDPGDQIMVGCTISGNVFDSSGAESGAGAGVSGFFFSTAITGNTFKGGTDPITSGIELIGTDLVVSGNVLSDGPGIAIAAVDDHVTQRVTITGNTIQLAATANAKGILVGSNGDLGTSDVTITGNTIDMSASSGSMYGIGLGIYGTAGMLKRAVISGNLIFGDDDAAGAGIFMLGVDGSEDVLISGNRIFGVYRAISVYEASPPNAHWQNVTVVGNDARGCGHILFADSSFTATGWVTGGNFTDYGVRNIASASTITLLTDDDVFNVTGTTTITSVTASWPKRRVTLIFGDALTFTDGSNLALAGNFTTTANDTITLVCGDGSTWYEVCRSVN